MWDGLSVGCWRSRLRSDPANSPRPPPRKSRLAGRRSRPLRLCPRRPSAEQPPGVCGVQFVQFWCQEVPTKSRAPTANAPVSPESPHAPVGPHRTPARAAACFPRRRATGHFLEPGGPAHARHPGRGLAPAWHSHSRSTGLSCCLPAAPPCLGEPAGPPACPQVGGSVWTAGYMPASGIAGLSLFSEPPVCVLPLPACLCGSLPTSPEGTRPPLWGVAVPFLIDAGTSPAVHLTIIWALNVLTRRKVSNLVSFCRTTSCERFAKSNNESALEEFSITAPPELNRTAAEEAPDGQSSREKAAEGSVGFRGGGAPGRWARLCLASRLLLPSLCLLLSQTSLCLPLTRTPVIG